MSNKSQGTAFELVMSAELYARGFWSHMLVPNKNGQPFDIIAVNKNGALAVDCKDCQSGEFDGARIEENQHMSMQLWKRRTGRDAAFAIRFDDGDIWMVKYPDARKKLNKNNIRTVGTRLLTFLRTEGYESNDQ